MERGLHGVWVGCGASLRLITGSEPATERLASGAPGSGQLPNGRSRHPVIALLRLLQARALRSLSGTGLLHVVDSWHTSRTLTAFSTLLACVAFNGSSPHHRDDHGSAAGGRALDLPTRHRAGDSVSGAPLRHDSQLPSVIVTVIVRLAPAPPRRPSMVDHLKSSSGRPQPHLAGRAWLTT